MGVSERSGRRAAGRKRIDAARAAMVRDGFDGLLLTTGTNLCFLTGYPFAEGTLARPFYFIVPRNGEPVLLVHSGREAEARRYSWVTDVRTYERLSVAPIDGLRRVLTERGLHDGRIGMELGFEQRLGIPVLEFERIRAELAPATFRDAATTLWRLRAIKSDRDMAALREACRITSEAYVATFAELRAGDLDTAAAERLRSAMATRGGAAPWVLVTSGRGNYELATGMPADRALEPTDMLWFDAGCSVDGFWSDFSRAACVGGPTREQLEAQEIVSAATRAGLERVRPGAPVAEVAAACNERLHSAGMPVLAYTSDLAGRVGHGIGYDATEPPHVSETDTTVLEEGMVISVEPGFATDFGLFHVEQNVLVTADGHEVLSTAPWGLWTIDA
jgi:Xaa-Pro dipeptidase